MVPEVEALAGCLREVAWHAQQKVGERIAGFSSVNVEGPVKCSVRVFVDLIIVKLAAELQRVGADDFRESNRSR